MIYENKILLCIKHFPNFSSFPVVKLVFLQKILLSPDI
jgi:hypothetical protein